MSTDLSEGSVCYIDPESDQLPACSTHRLQFRTCGTHTILYLSHGYDNVRIGRTIFSLVAILLYVFNVLLLLKCAGDGRAVPGRTSTYCELRCFVLASHLLDLLRLLMKQLHLRLTTRAAGGVRQRRLLRTAWSTGILVEQRKAVQCMMASNAGVIPLCSRDFRVYSALARLPHLCDYSARNAKKNLLLRIPLLLVYC